MECNRGCDHVGYCTKLCKEICDIPKCTEPCTKLLKGCKHKCLGLCGERCPRICRICTPNYIEPISQMKLSEFDESDRFISIHGDQVFLVENLDNYMNMKNDDGKIILKKCPSCNQIINSRDCPRYKDIINQDWSDFNKIKSINKSAPLSKKEKDAIVKSFGVAAGHWFKCKNDHYYFIGECGGAMQISKCIECDEKVGGTNHTLLPSNQLAGEIDGANKPLYQPIGGNFL